MYEPLFFIFLILLVMFVVWASAIPGEEKMQGGFDSLNRKETFGKNIVEVPYTSSFNLEENQQLLVVGVNHQKGLGCYWSLGFNSMTNEKLHEINAKNCTDDNFTIRIAPRITKGAVLIDKPFYLSEIVYSKRKVIHPKTYIITY